MRVPDKGERTEKATPKRREDERKKGNVFQSRDIVSATSLVIIFISLLFLGPMMFSWSKTMVVKYISIFGNIKSFSKSDAGGMFADLLLRAAVIAGPLLLIAAGSGYLLYAVQTRFLISFSAVKPKMNRINPLSGLRRMFSMRSLVELFKAAVKIVIIGVFVYLDFFELFRHIGDYINGNVEATFGWTMQFLAYMALRIAAVIFSLGVLDYFYQWWEYEKSIRMAKQEIKEEHKQLEGDPLVRSRIKERQRKMAMQRMMQSLGEADVVIRNPTHYAVAIKYDEKKHRAPVVLAKGQDNAAFRIIEKASKLGIRLEENPPLARALFDACEIDQEIPPDFYQAVAEILAFIYNLRKKERYK